jgi:hypothetical protein
MTDKLTTVKVYVMHIIYVESLPPLKESILKTGIYCAAAKYFRAIPTSLLFPSVSATYT